MELALVRLAKPHHHEYNFHEPQPNITPTIGWYG